MNPLFKQNWLMTAMLVALFTIPAVWGEEKAQKDKTKTENSSSGHAPQGNAFTRFWIHTVGAPMAKGMKGGMKTTYKGLRSGTHKIKEGFMTIGGYDKNDKKSTDAKKGGKQESGKLDYPLRRDFKGPALARHPNVRDAFEQYTGRSLEKEKSAEAKAEK